MSCWLHSGSQIVVVNCKVFDDSIYVFKKKDGILIKEWEGWFFTYFLNYGV